MQEDYQNYSLKYKGQGGEFFSIIIINWLLTALTLGLYYPWAKAKKLKYIYSNTYLNDSPFTFSGTGKEMFVGFIKVVLIFLAVYGLLFLFVYFKFPIVGFILFYLVFFALIPFALHGSLKYRLSRTSWRGIRFGYNGDRNWLVLNFFKWMFFTLITIGIYGQWMLAQLRNYTIGNSKFGDVEFKSDELGMDLFIINIKGYFLTIFTLGIYLFWWQKERFEYLVNKTSMQKEDKTIEFSTNVTGGDFFKLTFINLLILIFTFGFGYAWVVTRTFEFYTSHIHIYGNIDLNTITQTEANYKDATGEDVGDYLNLDFNM